MIKVLEKEYLEDDFIDKNFISNININDKFNFSKNNIYYFGNYKEEKLQEIKLKLRKNKKCIKKAIENGVKMIVCYNSFDLFNNSFDHKDINLFTCYNNKMFKNKINKLKIKKDKLKNNIIKVNNINKVITAQNFMYKKLICIKDPKLLEKIIKKQSITTLSC